MFEYTLKIHQEPDSIWLTSSDIPELHIAGDTLEQALASALNDLEAVLSIYVSQRRSIPVTHRQPQAEEVHLHLPARTAAKIALWNALLESGTSRTELARRLCVPRSHVYCLINFLYPSKIENIERALHRLGRRISIRLESA
ncbi:type II toxin-antitoxin system HicB family antitoxin [Pseudomonas sp. MDT1-17]